MQNYKGNSLVNFIGASILYTLPIVFIVLFWLAKSQTLSLFPGNIPQATTDSSNGGNSKVLSSVVLKDQACAQYKLEKGYQFPYFVYTIFPKSGRINFQNYNQVSVKIKDTKSSRIPVRLYIYVPGLTRTDNVDSYLYYTKEFVVKNGEVDTKAPLDDFFIPDWWYTLNNITDADIKLSSLHSIDFVSVASGPELKAGAESTMCLFSFQLSYNPWLTIKSWIWLVVVYYLFLSMVLFFLSRYRSVKKEKVRFVAVKENEEIVTYKDTHSKKVFEYLASGFQNSELSLSDMSTDLGWDENKISGLIKDQYDMSFKQYLNVIRLKEAERLLKHSDFQISEIAFKVGYNNVQHFNRVFRQMHDMSPGQFRDLAK